MKAIVVTRPGGPEVLELRDVPDPQPKPDEQLVNVEAVGVNFADTMGTTGAYPTGPQPPYICGREFAGTTPSGERVMGYAQEGACAEKIAVPRHHLWPQFPSWTSVQSAAFPVVFLTAWLAYWKAGLIRSGVVDEPAPIPANRKPRVLIHAAAGGVGTAAVQLGHLIGCETFGTASSDDKLARLAELGLDHAINYKRDDYEVRIRELTRADGVNAVFEMLGGEHTAKSQRCLAFLGRVILYGTASGEQPRFDTASMYSKSSSVHGLWLSRLANNVELVNAALAHMRPFIESGKLKPVIGTVLPLTQTADAHRMMLDRTNFGKIVLTV